MTVGWIREGDIDRFLEARYPLIDDLGPCLRHPCPFCPSAFGALADLYGHLHSNHVVPRPYLLLGGREPGGEHVIRRRIPASDILLLDTHSAKVSVDGQHFQPVDAALLGNALGSDGFCSLEVILMATPVKGASVVSERYKLKVRIASDRDLEASDRAFVRWFGRAGPRLLEIDDFMRDGGRDSAVEYAGALADYILGVLLKDGAPNTGIRDASNDWTVPFKRALQVLSAFQRPLANLICSTISFALNDFSRWRLPSAFPALDFANGLLGPMSEGVTPDIPKAHGDEIAKAHVCPIDAGSDHLIQFADRCAHLQRWSMADDDIARHLATSTALGVLDRAKMLALWALFSQRLASQEAAKEPLTLLLNNESFGAFAERQLGAPAS